VLSEPEVSKKIGCRVSRIAFCTVCGNRVQHLRRTLEHNLAVLRERPDSVAVLLDYGSSDGLGDWLREHFVEDLQFGRLVYYRVEANHFAMAHAKNLAHRLGIREGAEILCNVDADNFLGSGFPEFIGRKFAEAQLDGDSIFLAPRMNHQGPGRGLTDFCPPGSNGRIVVTREQFLNAGGYDEHFEHYGPDDKDFDARLRRIGYTKLAVPRRYMEAIKHSDEIRFRNYAPGAPQSREEVAETFKLWGRKDNRVANHGDFGIGQVVRNFDGRKIDLARLPTRIFGIGLHKTATTSLAAALEQLGFNTAHWISAQWAKSVAEQIEAGAGRSVAVEQFYALADLPIGPYFRELDQAYPGSKLILTLRETAEWVASAERHWRKYFGTAWKTDPYSNQLHRMIYGRSDFDAETMRTRYDRHTREVLEHFRDRPGDLLVMDMSAGAGWAELCGFLDLPRPAGEYPIWHTSRPPAPAPHHPG
jgi:hypothetical protein